MGLNHPELVRGNVNNTIRTFLEQETHSVCVFVVSVQKHILYIHTFVQSGYICTCLGITRCVEFCHMSSGWFDCTEPSLSTSLQR